MDTVEKSVKASMGVDRIPVVLNIVEWGKDQKIWLTVDWHLFLKDRDAVLEDGVIPVNIRKEAQSILCQYTALPKEDCLIHMGDLVDDEFYKFYNEEQQHAIFEELFGDIKCGKILLLGNNDPYEKKALYESVGFIVCDAIVYKDILFTHMPTDMSEMPEMYNIHGHSHGHCIYWRVPYNKHLDIWNTERIPILFDEKKIKEIQYHYSRNIRDISALKLPDKKAFIEWRGKSIKSEGNY